MTSPTKILFSSWNSMGRIRLCLSGLLTTGILFLSGFAITCQGQTASTSFSYTTDNDTLKIIAQTDEWIGPLLSMTIVFSFDSLVWHSGVSFELDNANSWYLDDGNYTQSIIVDTSNHQIRLTLNRTAEALSGSGYVCTLTYRGITVIGDDIMRLSLVSRPSFYPNPTQNYLYLSAPEEIQALDILDMQGRRIACYPHPPSKLSVQDWPRGIYLLKFHTKKGNSVERIRLY